MCSAIRVLPNKDLQSRHVIGTDSTCSWLNAGANACVGACTSWSCDINRASKLWKLGKSWKWQSTRNNSLSKKFSTKSDDLGVIYNNGKMLYPARWKKITVDQSKVLKNLRYIDCSVFGATQYKLVAVVDFNLKDTIGATKLHEEKTAVPFISIIKALFNNVSTLNIWAACPYVLSVFDKVYKALKKNAPQKQVLQRSGID